MSSTNVLSKDDDDTAQTQCRLDAWAHRAVANLCMLCIVCFLMFKY